MTFEDMENAYNIFSYQEGNFSMTKLNALRIEFRRLTDVAGETTELAPKKAEHGEPEPDKNNFILRSPVWW